MKATNTLKELKKDFECNVGYELGIKGVGKFDIDANGRVYTESQEELKKVIEIVKEFEDFGKVNYDGRRADFNYKNGVRALTVFIK